MCIRWTIPAADDLESINNYLLEHYPQFAEPTVRTIYQRTRNPLHPGRIVRYDCLEPLGLSVTAGAKVLGVTRQTLNKIVNGRSSISPEMAIRLTKAFGSTPETWLLMQVAYDLAQVRKDESKIKVRRQYVPQELHVR